jgi:hypothetical protein
VNRRRTLTIVLARRLVYLGRLLRQWVFTHRKR